MPNDRNAWPFSPTAKPLVIVVPTVFASLDKDGNQTGKAEPGPAFVTRAESGDTWSGDEKQLKHVVNSQDISRLVVFDTWTLNCDRHSFPPAERPQIPRVNRNFVLV